MFTFGSRNPNSSGLRCEAFRPSSTPPATPIAAVAAGITTLVTVSRVPLRAERSVPFVVAEARDDPWAAFEREPAAVAREPPAVRFAADLAPWLDGPLPLELNELLRGRDADVLPPEVERAFVPLESLFRAAWADGFVDLVVAIFLPPFVRLSRPWRRHRLGEPTGDL